MLLQFESCLQRIDTFLKLLGLSIYGDDSNKTMTQRLTKYWGFIIHMCSYSISVLGASIWLGRGIIYRATLWEMTYVLPCLALGLLGLFKTYYFIRFKHYANDVIETLRKLQSSDVKYDEDLTEEMQKWIKFLYNISKLLLILTIVGVMAFAVGPFVIMASHYYSTAGEIKLFLPFLVWYPFDAYVVKTWPVVFLHQLWSAWVTVFCVYGPDLFFYTSCTFIQIEFLALQNDLEQMIKTDSWDQHHPTVDAFKSEFVELVNRHRELIRCVNLLEIIYSKSTLFNVISSSLIICATGFNLMAIKNYALMAPFTVFLTFGLLQVFFYCFYGDYLMRSSIGVGDAVYNSHWYKTGASQRKYLLIVLVRSQTPCRLTAYGFADVNLTAFTRILSTSWSYFALLKQTLDD